MCCCFSSVVSVPCQFWFKAQKSKAYKQNTYMGIYIYIYYTYVCKPNIVKLLRQYTQHIQISLYICIYMHVYANICISIYIYTYMVTPPPHDRPSPLKHRPHRRIRAFPEVSSFSPDFVCPEPHPGQNQKTKNPKSHGECGDSFGFLDFWFFGFLVFRIFGFLVFWFCHVKSKNPKIQNCPHILRETLDFWFFGFGCSLVPVTASAFIQIIIPLLKLS